jgi:pyruvate/2-oxoglutarate dehydrogenase complex dihydrolipoamide acyltransferase (E2) component
VTAPIAVHAPELGSVEPVRVTAWLVDVGETVRAGDRLVELLMPGVTFDVSAPATGRLADVAAPVNSGVRAGDLLGHIAPDDDV